jgi:hypothetical protein
MRLKDRIERIEQMMDGAGFGDDRCKGPTVIRIHGGLDGFGPLRATIRGLEIESHPNETENEFEDRAVNLAIEKEAVFVVIGGLRLGGTTRTGT